VNKILSQEEIEVLLGNNSSFADLSPMEKDTLGELANISMGAAATTLSTLAGKKTEITTPKIDIVTWEELQKKYSESYVFVAIDYKVGLEGKCFFILHQRDAGVLVDLMMGGDGNNPPPDLNDLHLSAISEVTNQMMGSATTSLSEMLHKRIEVFSPIINVANLQENNLFAKEDQNYLVTVAFDLTIENLVDSETVQLLPISFAKQIVSELYKEGNLNNEQPEVVNSGSPKHVEVTSAQFPAFSKEKGSQSVCPSSLDLIMDIGLQLSVELGRTKKRIKEILELTNGSIVELDKLAGEPVDILINDKLLAKGEVVIIDENFGVRVTEIVSPEDRIKNFK
jgi:flagellar motor switch protein FliN/FliY